MHPASELILRNAEACSSGAILLINPPRDLLAIELGHPSTQLAEPPKTVIPESREVRLLESSLTPPKVPIAWIPDVCGAKSGMTVNEGESAKSGMTVNEGESAKSGMKVNEGESAKSGMTGRVTVFSQDFADASWLQRSGINCQFGLLPQVKTATNTLPTTVILFLPREKGLLEFLLHFIATHLPAEGQLWLAGENRAGIKSAETRLKERFPKVQKRDAARHCVLYVAHDPKTWEAAVDPTGADEGQQAPGIKAFSPHDYVQEWTLPTTAGEIRLHSLPGAFAHGRLDKGTALLLDYLQRADSRQLRIKGKVLDFGCGAGVIGLYLKRQYPGIELEMLDSSAVALESSRLSLQLNECEAQLTASDGLDAAKGRYDWIISNPPFHKGVATDFDIAHRFIGNAPAKLGNRGRLLLVCNRHLPYEAWLAKSFVGFEKVAENREFKVLLAHGPNKVSQEPPWPLNSARP